MFEEEGEVKKTLNACCMLYVYLVYCIRKPINKHIMWLPVGSNFIFFIKYLKFIFTSFTNHKDAGKDSIACTFCLLINIRPSLQS